MNAPTGRNSSVSVRERAMAASDFPNSFPMAVNVMTTRKKSNASSVQPRNPATTAARRLGARWVAKGTISNLSNLVWLLSADLLDVTTGRAVLADSYEIKGEAARMAPGAAHMFAQRIEKTAAGALR